MSTVIDDIFIDEKANWLKRWRFENGYTQYAVSKILNVSQSKVWKMENGYLPIPREVRKKLKQVKNKKNI